jgi:hypothetical protein
VTDAPHAIESPTVLANRGVPVVVQKTRSVIDPDDPEKAPSYEPIEVEIVVEGQPVTTYETEHRYIALPGVVIAFLEERYGNMPTWQSALAEKPYSTVLETLGSLWRESRAQVSARLLEGRIEEYVLALQVAAYRAQGVPVDDLGKLLKRGMQEASLAVHLISTTVTKMAESEMTTPEEVDAAIEAAFATSEQSGSVSATTNEPAPTDASPASTRGGSGSKRGSAPGARSTSSGPRRPRKSTSSSKP